ncbi:MAG: AAA family ATPase [Candidatus Parcubacteria bacterium]|nr:AAA family ATPase [Candidatus Parcubacteria bacterium]
MYLEKLEIQGFKSFANKVTLQFPNRLNSSKGITGVVGPNGSGKSNVADAIRWVLGEQSIKTLRGKKSQDVIFSGSDKKSRLGFAETTMYLNNEDHAIDIEYSELAITRRVYQNGESEYFINKNKARLADIHLLLAKANFGQRTYSIIGQGMADSVLSASLAERKELFDEAVGVRQFQIKREQALNKFKATIENLAQTELTLQELEPRLKSLTRQVKKLEKREEIEKELRKLQFSYFNKNLSHLEKNISQNEIQKNSLEKIYSNLASELEKIQSLINQYSSESSRQALYEKLQADNNTLIQQKNALLRDQALIKSKLDVHLEKTGQGNLVYLNKRADEINIQLTNLKQEISEITLSLTKEQTEINSKNLSLDSINQRLERVKEELNQIQKNTQVPFEAEKELEYIFNAQQELVKKLLSVKKIEELAEIKNQAREISQKLSLYLEKFKLAKKQGSDNLITLQNQLEMLTVQKNNLSQEINQINLNIQVKKEKISNLENEAAKLKTEKEKTANELSLNQLDPKDKEFTEQIQTELNKIEDQTSSLENQIKEKEDKIRQFNQEEQTKKEQLISLQKNSQEKQSQINQHNQQINGYNIELAKFSTKKEDLVAEIKQENLNLQEIINYKPEIEIDDNTYPKIQQLKRQMEIIGSLDEETQKEYMDISERYNFLKEQSDDLKNAIQSLQSVIQGLDKTIQEQFDKSFKEINLEFQKYFKILFNGGQSELIKVSADEIKKEEKDEKETDESAAALAEAEESGVLAQAEKFAKDLKQREKESYAGIEIKAVPPGKKIKSISMLSGGERALTSIALICAIISNNPSPFVVLDEVDAPLDEANAERFNAILDELAHKTQFIVITHNRVTMHYADVLYGVTMGDDGISKLLSIKLADAEEIVGQGRG